MQDRETCVVFQAWTNGFYLKIPQISVFIVYSVEGRRMKHKCEVMV